MRNMEINGLTAQVHLPNAPKGDGVHRLPPCRVCDVYKVDDYQCPSNWMHGSGAASSYFFGLEAGKHLWLDFNRNWNHSHHVAIVMSVQGINPVNGLPTKVMQLEQYREKCPLHDEPFGDNRFCQKCADKVPAQYNGFDVEHFPVNWAPQNYMTTVSHDYGKLWADGWYRNADEVAGFLITEETMRGVAANIIGEDRVFAIGIAFYLSKNPRQIAAPQYRSRGICGQSVGHGQPVISKNSNYESTLGNSFGGSVTMDSSCDWVNTRSTLSRSASLGSLRHMSEAPSVYDSEVTKVEVGAGARIEQDLCKFDPSGLDFYNDTPAGLIYINYCLKYECDRIIAAGKIKQRVGSFLEQIPTGNP